MPEDEDPAAFDEALLSWLKAQPDNVEIRWYSDHLSIDEPWCGGWADILCDAIQKDLPCGWVWTLEPSNEDIEVDAKWDFPWNCDMVRYTVWDPDWNWRRGDPEYNWTGPQIYEWAVPLGTVPSDEQVAEMQKALDGASPEAGVFGSGAWSVQSVNAALTWWCKKYADKDVTVVWDHDHDASPMLQQAREALEAMKSGIEPTYLLKPGEAEGGEGVTVKMSEQVMDMLLREEFGGD